MKNILEFAQHPGVADTGVVEDLSTAIGDEPCSADEALKTEEWHMVMRDELASIEENHTWSLVNLLKGHRAIGLCCQT
jgi:hypothetical protein